MKLKSIKSFIILIIILAFLGCQSQENKNRLVSIDYSYFDGYYRCIKINRDGQVYLQYDYDYPERHEKYTFKLNDSQLDSIINLSEKLYNSSIDSIIYQQDCISHCISFSLIVNYNDQLFETSYNGNHYSQTEFIDLFRFAAYLDRLMYESSETIDSSFIFKSKTKLILPPPPPEINDN